MKKILLFLFLLFPLAASPAAGEITPSAAAAGSLAVDGTPFPALHLDQLARVRRQVPSVANRMPDRYRWPEPSLRS